jgi:hypothetical protein
MPTPEYVESINEKWRGFGIGYDNGLWGRGFAQGIKLDIPFGLRVGQFIGLRIRSVIVHPLEHGAPYDPVFDNGIEIFGRGPVLLGVLRLYGGGGVWVGIRPSPTAEGRSWGIGGGGHVGIEGRMAERVSLTFEIGGQGPAHALGLDSGASIMGGTMVYLGALRQK